MLHSLGTRSAVDILKVFSTSDHPHQAELEDCYHKGRRVSKGFNAQYGNTLIIKISSNRGNNKILTAIFTTLVRARTRTVSKKVKRFLSVGRVVMKKLTRATQQKLVAVKESRQRSNITAAAISQIT